MELGRQAVCDVESGASCEVNSRALTLCQHDQKHLREHLSERVGPILTTSQ